MTSYNADKLVAEIGSRLEMLTDKSTNGIRTFRRELSRRLASEPSDFVFLLSLKLLETKETVAPFFAYELVQHHREASRGLNSRKLKQLGEGISSWGEVDTFACYLSGPAWRERQVPDSLIARWARSKNRWWRRAAVVSTVPLNNKARGGHGDALRTLQICQLVVHDRDDMVLKALSWALRELAKRDSNAVKTFLNKNKQSLASRVVREVNNKLKTGLKNPHKL
jgi:3-methyladenine DNA glycosylase AlkD